MAFFLNNNSNNDLESKEEQSPYDPNCYLKVQTSIPYVHVKRPIRRPVIGRYHVDETPLQYRYRTNPPFNPPHELYDTERMEQLEQERRSSLVRAQRIQLKHEARINHSAMKYEGKMQRYKLYITIRRLVDTMISYNIERKYMKKCVLTIIKNVPYLKYDPGWVAKFIKRATHVRLYTTNITKSPVIKDPGCRLAIPRILKRLYDNARTGERNDLRYNGVLFCECMKNFYHRIQIFGFFAKSCIREVIKWMSIKDQGKIDRYLSELYRGLVYLNLVLNTVYIGRHVFIGDDTVATGDTLSAIANYGSLTVSSFIREIYVMVRNLPTIPYELDNNNEYIHLSRPVQTYFYTDELAAAFKALVSN